ncbi:MAG: glycosyltransferase family 39 protein [Anaerolineales bacterium]|nr:glycosyltransferase family 39 protein [Anaerolineales bacterium]
MAFPAWLLVSDRWLSERHDPQWLRDYAGGLVAWVERISLPPYILIVFACLAGLLLVALLAGRSKTLLQELLVEPPRPGVPPFKVSARQRKWAFWLAGLSALAASLLALRALLREELVGLGWGLAALGILFGILGTQVPLQQVRVVWGRRAGPWLAMAAVLLWLLALLGALYSRWLPVWAAAALLALAALNLWRYRRQVPAVFWLLAGALVFYSWDINGWWFAAVGDEFAFYRDANYVAHEAPLRLTIETFFKGNFVYSAHPFFSTLLQAVFFKVFGASNFAWRISSLFYAAISISFFNYFFRTFLREPYALIAAFVLAASHYIAAFGKVGYNNLQALLALSLVLAAAAWVLRSRGPAACMALGLAQALCFYVYPAALYVAPLPYLLLLLYDPPFSPPAFRRWALALGTLALFVFPLINQPEYWNAKVAGTLAYTPELVEDSANAVSHLSNNFVYSLLSPLFAVEEKHFVVSGYLDPLTAVLSFLGLALLLVTFWRHRFLAFWLAAFALMVFLVGMSHDRPYPPSTRMFLLLPFLAVLVAIALAWLKLRLSELGLRPQFLRASALLLAVLILGLNIYQAYPLSYRRMTGYQNFEGLFLEIGREYLKTEPEGQILIVHELERLHIDSLTELFDIYQVPYQAEQVSGATADELQQTHMRQIASDPGNIVVVDIRLPEEELQLAESVLAGLGKSACRVQHALGHDRFILWHAPGLAALCPPLIDPDS